jgi:5-methylcytosine-specific restriction endonuclease McrA
MRVRVKRQTKVCPRCGETLSVDAFHRNRRKPDGLDSCCKACNNARQRAAYAKNPQKKIARTRQYHAENPEWSRERLRAHHVANRDERYQRYVERGKDPQVRAKRRESTRRSEQRRRAIKAASEVVTSITAEELERRLEEFDGCCYICGASFEEVVLHWDHYRPLAHGGEHSIENLNPACDLCNVRKNAMWPIDVKRLEQIKAEVIALRKSVVAPDRG